MRHSVLAVLAVAAAASAGVGESAVITLVFPHSARAYAMGEVGVALADGEDAAYWNPAGLGVHNPRWTCGAGTFFYEPLLPAFGIRDLWHLALDAVWQPWDGRYGGIALDMNYLHMGVNEFYDELGQEVGTARSHEEVLSLAWGGSLPRHERHNVGMALKVVHSALAPGMFEDDPGAGVANAAAVDAGYLWLSPINIRLGVTLNNMGTAVEYVAGSGADPIPFTVRLAMGHKDTVAAGTWPILDWALETMLEREFVECGEDGRPYPWFKALVTDVSDGTFREEFGESQLHWGLEATLFETLSLRSGLLFDWTGERYEWHLGFGLRVLKHLQFDWGYIHSPEGMMKDYLQRYDENKEGASGARHGQWQIQFTGYNLGCWKRSDFAPLNLDKSPIGYLFR